MQRTHMWDPHVDIQQTGKEQILEGIVDRLKEEALRGKVVPTTV